MAAPVTAVVMAILFIAALVLLYQGSHVERIYTGVMAWGLDLSGMEQEQAREALQAAFPYPEQNQITFIDSGAGRQWTYSLAELGLTFDVETTIDTAYVIGRAHAAFLPSEDVAIPAVMATPVRHSAGEIGVEASSKLEE